MDQNSGIDEMAAVHAARCIDDLRLRLSAPEFGYKLQAVAAHVLLRLNFEVQDIRRSGHPDIIATRGVDEYRFEIEAEVVGSRARQLKSADFESLLDVPRAVGYFALAISSPRPRWVIVPADRLVDRKPCRTVLLDVLSDIAFSHAWTHAYTDLLSDKCRRIRRATFRSLCEGALAGDGL